MTADAESKTPFTDARAFQMPDNKNKEEVIHAHWARQLEADLARKAEEVAELKRGIEEDGKKVAKFLVEQTEQVASLRRELEKAKLEALRAIAYKSDLVEAVQARLAAEQDAAALRGELRKHRLLHWLISQDVVMCGDFIYNPDDRDPRNVMLSLMMNDTFHYASAESEPFSLDDVDDIAAAYKTWGNPGVVAWASLQRGQDPLRDLMDADFLHARKCIQEERAARQAKPEGKHDA